MNTETFTSFFRTFLQPHTLKRVAVSAIIVSFIGAARSEVSVLQHTFFSAYTYLTLLDAQTVCPLQTIMRKVPQNLGLVCNETKITQSLSFGYL